MTHQHVPQTAGKTVRKVSYDDLRQILREWFVIFHKSFYPLIYTISSMTLLTFCYIHILYSMTNPKYDLFTLQQEDFKFHAFFQYLRSFS